MSTAVMLRDQLSELRMVIDHDDPAHVAAEAAFAAMVAEIMQAADIGPRNRGVSTNADVVVLQGTPRLVEEIEHPGEGPPAESLALRLMRGTAEAYDWLASEEGNAGSSICTRSAASATC
ncbi:MAG TPA: hypothetical protein VH913_24350 [Hyphomicrobiaceae bacterium]